MGLVRLSVLTLAGLGASMYWFGRDAGVPDDPIGRETALISDDFITAITGSGEESQEDERLARALASDASPETATLVAFRADRDKPAAQPAVATVEGGETGVVGTASEPEANRPLSGTEKPAAEPEADYLYVTGSRVNVRGGPSTAYGVISSLGQGTRVEDIGDAGNGWRQVVLTDTGERGFMAGRFLSPQQP
ncbi:SH3 domain-containing protein [Maritimibacter sp. UBA3975]|uniref:SH3 domain-containing protein n=1 Tax=Maritimibacter sp. UBA3975 TaxID=1946833 RepID=UPI000C08F146|nr:SH3 domain-containing protein [Maritimibacter sp. UBA3975]MAM63766.1 hypothetical protein [Maritimibacter sp.]|tara:strand:+ start:8477 stop:9055 length:579 start_codon:yes stop_codon:yes gene_type:complete